MSNPKKITHEKPGKFEESRFEKIHSLTFDSAKNGSKLVAKEIVDSINSKKINLSY